MTDLLDLLAEIKRETTGPSLFDSPARGPQERNTEFLAWCEEHDSFNSFRRSHAWVKPLEGLGHRDDSYTARCQPTYVTADLGCTHFDSRELCSCVGGRVYRGACFGCRWEGPITADENEAVEQAHDHSWPGWRDLPTVNRRPEPGTSKKEIARMASWEATVNSVYPPGWLEAGGPIRTIRQPMATRHMPHSTGHGGYDLSAGEA